MLETRTANAHRPPNVRSRYTNNPRFRIPGMDGRKPCGRRRRDLMEAFVTALGHAPSEVQMIDIRRAAELTALAEEARMTALKQGNASIADLDALVRIEGAADRAVRRLGIKAGAPKPARTLADLVAERKAAAAAKEDT
jgi:hypothetical protein